MADLIAIGCDDTTTGVQAMDEVGRLAKELGLDGLSQYGGKVMKRSLSKEAEAEIQKELHGAA